MTWTTSIPTCTGIAEQSVGGVDGRRTVLSCRAACLIPSVSPSPHHSSSTLTVPSSPSSTPTHSHSQSLDPVPSPVSDHPCHPSNRILAVSGFTWDTLHQHPPAQPQTIPNPPSSKPAPFPKNQPVASTRPPVQVLHAAFRPDSVLLSLLASLVLPWHAAQRTHSFLLYIILPGTRQPTRASYKLTDANCSASAACVCVLCLCVPVCLRACARERVCVIARECGGVLSSPLPRFSSPSPITGHRCLRRLRWLSSRPRLWRGQIGTLKALDIS